jgi:hypothetical protein
VNKILHRTVGRLYAGLHEWFTFATSLRFSPETTAAFLVVVLLDLNVATLVLAVGGVPVARGGPERDSAGLAAALSAGVVVAGWLQTLAVKYVFSDAIRALAAETGNQRFWRAVGLLLYIGVTVVAFLWTIKTWIDSWQ